MADVKDLLQRITDRSQEAFSYWDPIFQEMVADLNFAKGDQWPDDIKKTRDIDGRPCLTINKVATFGEQIIGDIRQNEPSIKIKPVDSGADPDVAEIYTGLIRNIEVQSNAEIAYDTAAESGVWCGKGTFRVVTVYEDENSFDQDIRIKRMRNPFTSYPDPKAQEWDKSDANWWFITEKIPRDEFNDEYPDAMLNSIEIGRDSNHPWHDKDSVRIAEYFERKTEKHKLYLLEDPLSGKQFTSETKIEGTTVLKERSVSSDKVMWYKTNGSEILEGPTEWPSKYIPICEVWGKELNIEGETVYRGVIRNSKDPQRLYNYGRSNNAELTSLAPKAPYLVTAKMIANYQPQWDTAHKKSWPYLPYDIDPANPGMIPARAQPPQQSSALLQEIMVADQELHDTTGLQQANMGQTSNEKSGKAILARAKSGDTANYTYYDNLGRAMTYCGKIIVDLIPRVYDTARVLRLIGEDGNDKFVEVNQPVQIQTPEGMVEKVFDLTAGKYDVVVSIGQSYESQREEAVDGMINFLKIIPGAAPVIADLVVKNMDHPGSQEMAKRLEAMLPPQAKGGQPPPPDPMVEMKAQKLRVDTEGSLLDNKETEVDIAQKMRELSEPIPE